MDRYKSLRTKRAPPGEARAKPPPKGAAPGSARPSAPGRTLSKARDTRKSRVDDRIKTRMSGRYADISGPTDVMGVPAMPALPAGMSRMPTDGSGMMMADGEAEADLVLSPRTAESRVDELKMLDAKQFDPDAFLKLKLANSTEYELKQLQSSLRNTKDEVAADLQKNVFKNYAEFVHISKEIVTLENEMLDLKESLSEWKSMPSLLHIDDSASVAERRRNVRSSIADLRILYASQMQTLHSQIEGSAKFVPTTPGRHVVAEMENGLVALNAATFKPSHPVRFVLLDDSVLVARLRQRRNADGVARSGTISKSAGGKWVAERCWPLSEMLVLDTKDSPSMTNVFKIRHGKETHVYRAEAASDKKSLLSQFRHVAEELAAKRRREREGEHERRQTVFDRSAPPSYPDWMADLAKQAGMTGAGDAKNKTESDARWVGDFTDELTVAISLRNFDRAVKLVEEGEAKVATIPALASKLTPLTASLTSAVLGALSIPSNRKANVVRLIGLLNRLHAGPAARSTFLTARADVIRRQVRAIPFEGDVCSYVHDLAIVMFTGVKHSADWFLASFKENEVASGFVEWAKQQMNVYADLFRKQVFVSDADPKVVEQALHINKHQSKKLLEDYGLDFRFLFDEILVKDPVIKPTQVPARPRAVSRPPEPTRAPASTPRNRSPAPIVREPSAPTREPSGGTTTPRSRSPAASQTPTRNRTPAPPLPLQATPTSATGPSSPGGVPSAPLSGGPHSSSLSRPAITPRTRSPAPPNTLPSVSSPLAIPSPIRGGGSAFGSAPSSATSESSMGARMYPPRQMNGSPAPPPRSRDRPGSAGPNSASSVGSGFRQPAPAAVPKRQGMI